MMAPVLVPKIEVGSVSCRRLAAEHGLDLAQDAKGVEALRAAAVETEDLVGRRPPIRSP